MLFNRPILNFLIIIVLSGITIAWTSFVFHTPLDYKVVLTIVFCRMLASRFVLNDYSLSWSKASARSFLIKSTVYVVAFCIYLPIFYGTITIAFLASELFLYLFGINFLMYSYYYYTNKSSTKRTNSVVIYGAGKAGLTLKSEFNNSKYRVLYFIDDDVKLQGRSIDAINILSKKELKSRFKSKKLDLLVIAMPSASKERVKDIYENLSIYFNEIQILPSLNEILRGKSFLKQLKDITVEDLLARHPQDLDTQKIEAFVKDKVLLITGAGGSIGSEIARQCKTYGAKQLILLDHSEYNLYTILEELEDEHVVAAMQSVVNKKDLETTFAQYRPQIVIHAAAYKHVPLVELNAHEGIVNNILGAKNVIDVSIAYGVEKFVMISTDKAVRPTNVMGATKRICELYAQNSNGNGTDVVAVRFGNVLGSSGSVIPKFKKQIDEGGPITVTHPDIIRYFMLIPEACELVLQAGAIGSGGEVFILDMGEPVKIVDLAKKMIELSGKKGIDIEFTGLRPGEKLYEELLINDSDKETKYSSIMVAKKTDYDIVKLNQDIKELLECENKLKKLQEIVPEFTHKL